MISLLWLSILLANKFWLKHSTLHDEGPVGFSITMLFDSLLIIAVFDKYIV